MGLGSFLKKASPISIDRKLAQKVTGPLAQKIGGKRFAAPIYKTAGNDRLNREPTSTQKLKEGVGEIGPAFRAVDRFGGKPTPLQIDNAISRNGPFRKSKPARFVQQTTARGPEDGSDNRYYDSDRNATIAAAVVGAYFGAAALGGEAGAAGAGSDGLYAVNSFDSGAMAQAVGYQSPGWAGSGAGLLAENSFDSGAMWTATGNETPWYSGLGGVAEKLGKAGLSAYAKGQDKPVPIANTPPGYGSGANFTDNGFADSASGNDLLLWGLLGLLTLAGLAAVGKRGRK